MDCHLWKVENYRDFLDARRALLAQAANNFLDQLLHGTIPESQLSESFLERRPALMPASIASDEEEAALQEAMKWMEENNLPRGEYGYELVDADNELLATLDLAWPYGIQIGRGAAVALLVDEDADTLEIARQHDYKYFTTLEAAPALRPKGNHWR